jgi:outer membrane protein OmpA-like peptidoglycan-associated protein
MIRLKSMWRSAAAVAILAVLGSSSLIAQPQSPEPDPERETPADWKVNLGEGINSPYSELFPVITPDENMLFFTRKGSPDNLGFSTLPQDEDIWYTTKDSTGMWTPARRLEGPLNTTTYDGVRAINATATRLYLQNIYRKDGTRGKGFSVSTKGADGQWLFPEPLEIEDYYNDASIAMMAISQNEDILLLSVQRKDGVGKHDLYMCRKTGYNKFGKPELIRSLSNGGDDISPFLAYDDRTLYFSTDGRGGYGLHDVFVSRRLDDTWQNWSEPQNLGESINTPSFDAYLMVSARGDTAYFSSVHGSSQYGFGKSDVWKIVVPKDVRPGFTLPEGEVVQKEEEYEGSIFRLDSVFFDINKSEVRAESRAQLDNLVKLMQKLPNLTIEVQGHTDGDADEAYNLQLSLARANSVRGYLVANGVDEARVVAKGYGESQPIAPNTTQAGKQLNRRVMVLVTNTK